MPLNARSPIILHYLQNIFLIALCAAFTPLLTFLAILSTLISPFTELAQHINHRRKWRARSSSTFRPRTILVTGVGMSKGLSIARSFYRAGHHVIGADFEPYGIPVCGHFSKSIRFYRLGKPCEKQGAAGYVKDIVEIIRKEKVELWVSCSGVASAIEDGEAAERVERETDCVVVQFGVGLTETLHEKYSFVKHTMNLGLNVPLTYKVNSTKEALAILHPKKGARVDAQFIMKPEMVDDSVRADMTLLPLQSFPETEAHIERLSPSSTRPFVLQQYIAGREYCTHSIVLKGKIHAFVACRSSDMLMHYKALPPSSALSQAMLHYTTLYVQKTSSSSPITGHFSLDFLVNERIAENAERAFKVSNAEIEKLQKELFPIECNPRAHTAVVLLNDQAENMAEAYVTLLPDHDNNEVFSGGRLASEREPLVPSKDMVNTGYYWIGHDFVTKVLLPILEVLRLEKGIGGLIGEWMEFVKLVMQWQDGTYEIWDPWPAWCLPGRKLRDLGDTVEWWDLRVV
ncbi:hypothetical protein SBOR_1915 [Sclerotinia borealis F-4128]|uniref:ATP-grasp domain-containing protein n=1 Tax=Sclerotinia borealis (strain F-4128) TaxID=1432307 RepID=W9CNW0_SCLBF|nr:hypothetical protein SBOR_1915 [Sclerotinia borealis F-4128]